MPTLPNRAIQTTPVLLAVSTVIFALKTDPTSGRDRLWVPLVRRVKDPFRGQWALPGGPLGSDEDLVGAASRTLHDTTGLAPRYVEQLYAFGAVNRSPDRVVSVVYWALVRSEEALLSDTNDNVDWFVADNVTDLAFDHDRILKYALWRLRNKVEYSWIAHTLMPETFTLAELRTVYETVLDTTLDPANFRRQIEASGAIEATAEFRTGGRHRPAKLYTHSTSFLYADHGPLDNHSQGDTTITPPKQEQNS